MITNTWTKDHEVGREIGASATRGHIKAVIEASIIEESLEGADALERLLRKLNMVDNDQWNQGDSKDYYKEEE